MCFEGSADTLFSTYDKLRQIDSKYWVIYENVCICILCLKINLKKSFSL